MARWWDAISTDKVRGHGLTPALCDQVLDNPEAVAVFAYPNPDDGWPREALAALTAVGWVVVVFEMRPDASDPTVEDWQVVVTGYKAGATVIEELGRRDRDRRNRRDREGR